MSGTKFKLSMYIHKTYPYIKFEMKVCKDSWNIDRKVNDDGKTEGRNDGRTE